MDLTFKTKEGNFNYRVGAIIIHDRKLLMAKSINAPYYFSVGGRVHLNESNSDAIKREVFEELGISLEIDRLAFVHENLFFEEVTKQRFHEIAFFYLMKYDEQLETIPLKYFDAGLKSDNEEINLEWISLDEIKDKYLYPDFFKKDLLSLTNEIKYIYTNEQK